MASKKKKIKAAGRFGAGYGTRPRKRFNAVEDMQHKKQNCPFCSKPKLKRLSPGIWQCKKCTKIIAGNAYSFQQV